MFNDLNQLIRPSSYEDIKYLAPRLRRIDKEEISLFIPITPEESLRYGIEKSIISFTGLHPEKGMPEMMFGLVITSVTSDFDLIWLLSTDEIIKYKFLFSKCCKAMMDLFFKYSPKKEIGNYILKKNVLHRKWLEHYGFKKRNELFLNKEICCYSKKQKEV